MCGSRSSNNGYYTLGDWVESQRVVGTTFDLNNKIVPGLSFCRDPKPLLLPNSSPSPPPKTSPLSKPVLTTIIPKITTTQSKFKAPSNKDTEVNDQIKELMALLGSLKRAF